MEIRAPRLLNLVLSIMLVSTLCLPTNLAFADSVSEADSNTVTLVGSDADFELEANEGDSELENASDDAVPDDATLDNTVIADNDSLEDNHAVLISEEEKAAALQELNTPEEELGYAPGEMIVVYDETATEREMAKAASAIDAELDSAVGDISAGTVSLVTISDDMTVATAIEAIEKDNAVVYAEPNYTVSLFDDDPVAFTQSNDAGYVNARDYLNAISAEQAWNYLATQSVSKTRVASIDTGAKIDHEDLKNVLNLTLSKEIVATGEGTNRKTTFEKLQGDGLVNGKIHSTITSSSTHGTHVAGIMAAQSNNGVGSAGVASGGSTKYSNMIVDLFAIDAFNGISSDNKETANIYDVVSAMQYAKDNKARVVNLSLGLFKESSTLQTICKDLYTNNVVMVCAAGNYNSTQIVYPAAYDTTIAVINCKNDGSRATYDSGAGGSTYGMWCDVAAPGYQIYSTTSSSTSAYGYLTGTSMAAPVVSSAAAMMIAVNPSLTPSEVKSILTETAHNAQKNEQTAWGMINAEKAVKEAVAKKANTSTSTNPSTPVTKPASVGYQTHVQNIGWQNQVKDGATGGTEGKSLRVEAFRVKLLSQPYSGGIQVQSHVQNIGWQGWVSNGAISGTSGRSLRVEALRIKLTGEMTKKYSVYYRTHCQNVGWTGWAKDGDPCGTSGYSYRMEAVQIKLVPKGSAAPGTTKNPYYARLVSYQTHVQNIGWQSTCYDGQNAGTTGRSLRVEAFKVKLVNPEYSGDIQVQSHVQNIGWQGWVSNGAISGTSGRSLRVEALRIKLTGEMTKKYSVYYRTHCQNVGWTGWAKDGDPCGTSGYSYRMEAVQIKLVPKGSAAPGSTARTYYQR